MKKITIYQCDYCGLHLPTEEDAFRCEKSHGKSKSIKYIEKRYISGCDIPYALVTVFETGEAEWYYYSKGESKC